MTPIQTSHASSFLNRYVRKIVGGCWSIISWVFYACCVWLCVIIRKVFYWSLQRPQVKLNSIFTGVTCRDLTVLQMHSEICLILGFYIISYCFYVSCPLPNAYFLILFYGHHFCYFVLLCLCLLVTIFVTAVSLLVHCCDPNDFQFRVGMHH